MRPASCHDGGARGDSGGRKPATPGEEVLQVSNLEVFDKRSLKPSGVSLSVRAGEILRLPVAGKWSDGARG
jgi:ABC-type uncharacterized transport system ATPase subunit